MPKKSPNHPFGRENEVSLKQLLTFFCNNVHLGQWELARACIQELEQQKELLQLDITDVLGDIGRNPYQCSLGSAGIITPHHLSWLCLQEFKKRPPQKTQQNVVKHEKQEQDVNFRLLLAELNMIQLIDGDSDILQQLYNCYQRLSSHQNEADITDDADAVVTLEMFIPSKCQEFLVLALFTRPALGAAVLQSLCALMDDSVPALTESLHMLHLRCLQQAYSEVKESSHHGDPDSDLKEKFLDILALFDPTASMLNLQVKLKEFFLDLIKTMHSGLLRVLDTQVIYSALLGRATPYLVQLYTELDGLLATEESISAEKSLGPVVDLSVTEICLVALGRLSDRREAWKRMAAICMQQQKHHLDLIMETAVHLIQAEDFSRLAALLAPEELRPLRCLVLLVGWERCDNVFTARQLLRTLWTHKDPEWCVHSSLSAACTALSQQLDLTEWCLNTAKEIFQQSSCHLEDQELALFQGLEGHSVLYMLHRLTSLSTMVAAEVIEFLQKRPGLMAADNGKSKKTVRFAMSADAPSPDVKQPISVEQEVDLSIYKSYCAMRHFMEAVSFCARSGEWEKLLPGRLRGGSTTEAGSVQADATDRAKSEISESSNSTLQLESLQQMYEVHVMEHLKQGQEYITQIMPLTQRLEVLENVFSLLFVTHEDIQEADAEGQSDSDEGAEGMPSLGSTTSGGKATPNSNEEVPESTGLDSWTMLSITDTMISGEPGKVKDQAVTNEEKVRTETTGIQVSGTLFGKYSVTKTELKAPSSGTEGMRNRLLSGNQSTNSTNSMASCNKIGFVCNEYVVRDILLTLKECLLNLSALKYSSHMQDSPAVPVTAESEMCPQLQEQLEDSLRCSVESQQLQQRISCLTHYVSEGLWRLQLVSHDWVPQLKGKLVGDTAKLDCSFDSEEDLDSSFEEDGQTRHRQQRHRKRCNSNSSAGGDYSASATEPSSDRATTQPPTTDGSVSAGSSAGRHVRRRHRGRRSKVKRLLRSQEGVIPRMLASKDTLLCMSLRRQKYAQAEQVVKMFNLEASSGATEMSFAEQYQSAVRKLQSQSSRSLQHQRSNPPPSRLKLRLSKNPLSAIASVAAVGVASMSAVSAVDQVLSLTSLPSFPAEVSSKLHHSGATYSCHVREENIAAMIVLDLACAGCKTLESSSNLLENARNRLPSGTMCESRYEADTPRLPARSSGVVGITKFLSQVSQLVGLGTTEGLPESLDAFYERGLNQALNLATFPLKPHRLQTLASASVEVSKCLKRVDKALSDCQKYSELSAGSGQRGRPEDKPHVRIAMKYLMSTLRKYLPPEGLAVFLLGGSSNRRSTFFSNLYDHVKSLAKLVTECQPQQQGGAGPHEYFTVLRESPTHIIGRVLFVNKVLPQKLEDLAGRLHLNLIHIIVDCCTPRIPCHRPLLPPSECKLVGSKVVLNHCETSLSTQTRHPELLVRALLTKLTQLMKDKAEIETMNTVFMEEMAAELVTSVEFQQVISQTRLLQFVDLTQLSSAEEKLSFYGNLVNLMTLHVMFFCSEKRTRRDSYCQGDLGRTRSESLRSCTSLSSLGSQTGSNGPRSSIDTMLLHSKMAYHVGQLGLVSLFDLKHVIVRQGLPPPECLDGLVAARATDLDALDPWHVYGPPTDSRLLFVISDGCPSSPPLQVLSSELVRSQLRSAMEEYLTRTVHLDIDTKQFTLPELLLEYQADFVSRPSLQSQASLPEEHSAQRHQSLLTFISVHVSGQLAGQLEQVIDAMHSGPASRGKTDTAQIIVQAACTTPVTYSFDYDSWHQQYKDAQTTAGRRSSLPPSLHQGEPSVEVTQCIQQLDTKGPHKLTSVTLEYLKLNSDLVSTLCGLISIDDCDDLQNELQENYFPAKTPEVERSFPGLFDAPGQGLRQFKYQCLQEKYPVLQRHTLHQIIAFLVTHDPSVLSCSDITWEVTRRNIPADMRTCILSAPSGGLYQRLLWSTVTDLTLRSKWMEVIELLANSPASATDLDTDWLLLKDHVLCCAGLSEFKAPNSTELDECVTVVDHWTFLLQIQDKDLLIRTILGSLRRWSAGTCVQLLKSSLSWKVDNDALLGILKLRLHEMEIFQKIMDYAYDFKKKMQSVDQHPDLSPTHVTEIESSTRLADTLSSWQGIVDQSQADPMSVVEFMLPSKKFSLIYDWAKIFSISEHLLQEIHNCYIFYLLEKDDCDVKQAFQMLERLRTEDAERCLEVTDNLLQQLGHKKNTLFVAEYVLEHMADQLSQAHHCHLRVLCIGCRALLCLPLNARADYDHLVSQPLLLMEQLLMNIKVDWAAQVLTSIKRDLDIASSQSGVQPLPLDTSQCEALLLTYATAALEFSVIQGDYSGSGCLSRSTSRMSLASSVAPDQQQQQQQQQQQGQRGHRRASSGSTFRTLSRLGTTPTGLRTSTSVVAPRTVSGSAGMPYKTNLSVPGNLSKRIASTPKEVALMKTGFVMPPEPPTMDQWVPDSAATVCMVCEQERFSMFSRRHHCRRCGRVVCSSCSSKTAMIRGRSARVCDDCHEQIFKPKEGAEDQKMQKIREKFARISGTSPGSGIQFTVGSGQSTGSDGTTSPPPAQVIGTEFFYLLSEDEENNELTREEFYYDHAPSTSLCLSILALHSDATCYGQTVLDLCDSVSKLLQPIAPGVTNPEVDYSFVISMLKTLLFNAKVKFVSVAHNDGVARCEIYLDRVNLLDLLVTNNCAFVPSVQQLTKQDVLRRLRDKLIEEERWSLAMEVSTKCGIDAVGVWISWGKACLTVGDYAAARLKFSKCFKPGAERGQTQMTAKLLAEILDALQVAPPPGANQAEAILAQLRSPLKDLLLEPTKMQKHATELHMEQPQMQECLYYLHSYGTPLSTLAFFRKHGCWMKAAQYVLERRCSVEIFQEGLLVPCLTSGDLGSLQDQMTLLDNSLESWSTYLTSACRYLNKMRHINVLYQMQLFMKDYIRASMTCISHFYQHGADSYQALHTRTQHLHHAKQHLEAYLEERQWGGSGGGPTRSRHPSWGREQTEVSARLIMTPSEVSKNVHTIDLQLEVTKFLNQYHDNMLAVQKAQRSKGSTSAATSATATGTGGNPFEVKGHKALPTLFGSTKVKAEVTTLVMLSGNNVHDGFGLAFRIIQDFRLDTSYIYKQVGRHFARCQHYKSIQQLLGCIKDSGLSSDQAFDEVIGTCVRVMADQPMESKEIEALIKMIRLETNKINAYILCGKLKSAYLIAVKSGRVEDIRRIAGAAERTGQAAVKAICDKWLQQRGSADSSDS